MTGTLRHALSVVAVLVVGGSTAAGQPFELSVEKNQLIGASTGTLTFDVDTVEYATTEEDDARRWTYQDIKQIQVRSPTTVSIKTYEDQGWTRLGADRTFEFKLTGGNVPPALASFLAGRVAKPLVLAVPPPATDDALFRLPAKLRRTLKGSEGVLAVHADHVAYETDDDDEHGRYWRDIDLYAVFQPDRYRLTLEVYEGGGDDTRAFSFDLKTELPPGLMEALWKRVYDRGESR